MKTSSTIIPPLRSAELADVAIADLYARLDAIRRQRDAVVLALRGMLKHPGVHDEFLESQVAFNLGCSCGVCRIARNALQARRNAKAILREIESCPHAG